MVEGRDGVCVQPLLKVKMKSRDRYSRYSRYSRYARVAVLRSWVLGDGDILG